MKLVVISHLQANIFGQKSKTTDCHYFNYQIFQVQCKESSSFHDMMTLLTFSIQKDNLSHAKWFKLHIPLRQMNSVSIQPQYVARRYVFEWVDCIIPFCATTIKYFALKFSWAQSHNVQISFKVVCLFITNYVNSFKIV